MGGPRGEIKGPPMGGPHKPAIAALRALAGRLTRGSAACYKLAVRALGLAAKPELAQKLGGGDRWR